MRHGAPGGHVGFGQLSAAEESEHRGRPGEGKATVNGNVDPKGTEENWKTGEG